MGYLEAPPQGNGQVTPRPHWRCLEGDRQAQGHGGVKDLGIGQGAYAHQTLPPNREELDVVVSRTLQSVAAAAARSAVDWMPLRLLVRFVPWGSHGTRVR